MENPKRRRRKNASAIIEGKEFNPMNQQNRLRRKLEKYAIPNLTLYLIICYGIGYLMQYLVPAVSVSDARPVPRVKRTGLETGHLDPDSAG